MGPKSAGQLTNRIITKHLSTDLNLNLITTHTTQYNVTFTPFFQIAQVIPRVIRSSDYSGLNLIVRVHIHHVVHYTNIVRYKAIYFM